MAAASPAFGFVHEIRSQVDRCERVTVAGNLLLRAVARCRRFCRKFRDVSLIGDDAFHAVGRFDALHPGEVSKGLKQLRRLPVVELLPPLVLAKPADGPHSRHRLRAKPRKHAEAAMLGCRV